MVGYWWFAISDFALCMTHFGAVDVGNAQFYVIATYYLAQMLIFAAHYTMETEKIDFKS